MDLANVTASDFQPLVDEAFTLDVEGGGELTLADVTIKPQVGPDGREAFVLLFRSGDSAVLPQATYHLEHSAMGVLDIFLVPVQQDAEQVLYEAVFS